MRGTQYLLLACVACLVSEALGGCTSTAWGTTTEGNGVLGSVFDTVVVDMTNHTNRTVNIPHNGGVGCEPCGGYANFCEATFIQFTDYYEVTVYADPESLATKGVLSGILYCKVPGPNSAYY